MGRTSTGWSRVTRGRCFVLLLALILPTTPFAYAKDTSVLSELLSQKTRLMVFSPHPDDETLGAGGLIQRVLRLGGKVNVIFMTSGDGYPEGVEMEDHVTHPTAQDYRDYGTLRQTEALHVLATLGVKKSDSIFLGFPDGGLYSILSTYQSDKGPDYTSPFTLENRPPAGDTILPYTEYNGEDLKREIARVLMDFHPTVIVTVHRGDQHPDHCSTYFFVRETLDELRVKTPAFQPQVLTFLIHFGQWPMNGGAGFGSRLSPPRGFAEKEDRWLSFPLAPGEVETKRRALLLYHSQMLIMGRYLLSFARANELFLPEQESIEHDLQERPYCGK
ncbi:MAG: PIG-L deacetylase family protein [Candidatus Binatia bacterium]